jgi:hypothetical protein
VGFLLFCVVPTLGVGTWAAVVRSSSYRTAQKATWERTLSDQLGLVATLAACRNPIRGVTVLEGLQLSDPETGQRIATVRQVDFGYSGGELVVQAAQPEIDGTHWRRLAEVLHERLLRSRRLSSLRARLIIGELSVHHADNRSASTWTDIEGHLVPSDTGPQLTFEFREAAARTAEPVRLCITRNRQVSPPITRWELHARTTPLPCALLADQFPLLGHLGANATFQGDVAAMPAADGWQGECTGRFRGVDLDRLVTDHFDHKLCGTAEVTFRRASFRGGKLQDAAGELLCDSGVISWSLLDQAERALGLVAAERVFRNKQEPLWPYRQLRFAFELSQAGLRLVGRCSGAGEGVVLADQEGPLLRDKPEAVVQAVALVRALAFKRGDELPATYEAYQLLHVLPVPSHEAAPSLSNGPPLYSPVRLRQ